MSVRHKGRYTDEEVAELRSRYSEGTVTALVAEADAVAAEEEAELLGSGDESETSAQADLEDLTVPQLQDRLEAAGLSKSGNKAELIERLRGA